VSAETVSIAAGTHADEGLPVPRLLPGACVAQSRPVTPPPYYNSIPVVILDADGQVAESNEGNNIGAPPMAVPLFQPLFWRPPVATIPIPTAIEVGTEFS